jgi:hypothetical protein
VPAPPLNPTTRYIPPGTRKTYYLAACANPAAPTRAELNAGVDLSFEMSAMTGFSVQAASQDAPDMGSKFIGQVGGRLSSASNDITMYLDLGSNDVRSLLPRGATGFIVQLWEGDVAGRKMSVFPVSVIAQAPDTSIENVGTVTISFAASRLPSENLSIPA